LIGKYISETGAATVIRSFSLGPGKNGQGPRRLVVALSAETFPIYQKYFTREEFLIPFGHAHLVHNGKVHSYTHSGIEFRFTHHLNTPLPLVLLKTSEARRAAQFFELYAKLKLTSGGPWHHAAAKPWMLPGYCAAGGYDNCTHWIGNMPLGDELVDEYTFPACFEAGGDRAPRTQKLMPYEHPDPLMHEVWSVPGHQQFADMIGQRDANLHGEFASPGWVITTILGPTSVERVPIVFVIVADHKAPIPADFEPFHEAAR
jgi:hypothetical protein